MRLENYMRSLYQRYGYEEVLTPQIFDRRLFDTSGHLPTYRENMFMPVTADLLGEVLGGSRQVKDEELERLGVLATRSGEGTFVTVSVPDDAMRERHVQLQLLARESIERAEQLGFTLADLIETIEDLRPFSRQNERGGTGRNP